MDRILSIGLDHPTASRHAFLLKLVKDREVPADTRMAVAPKCFPAKRTRSSRTSRRQALADLRATVAQEALAKVGSAVASKDSQTPALVAAIQDCSPQALDALLGVIQDATANPKAQRKAALKIAEFLLPKVGKKEKAIPDEYGFTVNPSLASAYRDAQLELRALVNAPTRIIPANAEKIKKLETRCHAILRRLQVPCPTKYGNKDVAKDHKRLMEFTRLRDNKTDLTEAQKAEEAHLKVRFDVFAASPESIARRRREALQDAERLQRRSTGDFYAPPLSRKDRNELELLLWLYPKPSRNVSELHDDWWLRGHPFQFELPAPDGNFYPRGSKLRPAAAVAADDRALDAADGRPIAPACPGDAPATGQSVELQKLP